MNLNKEKLPGCSLMIATYNWPEALDLCLMSVLAQYHKPDEIIIADDGSTSTTKKIIDRIAGQTSIPIVHIWHPDKGFQLATIRNKAIKAAKYDYLIQIDGDIILNQYFVYDHLKFAAEGSFLCGSRVSLSPKKSAALLEQKEFRLKYTDMPFATIFNSFRSAVLSRLLADRYKKRKLHALRGCNMSFWRNDLLRVNGYNQDITGWGSEDFELAMRLINSGIKKRFLKFGAVVYHIYHKENNKDKLQRNIEILEQTIKHKSTWIDHGISSVDSK